MITGFVLSIITSQIIGLLAGGAGFAIMGALAFSMIPKAFETLARIGALALVCWFAYSWGYRNADSRAETATMQTQIKILKADADLQRKMRDNALARLKTITDEQNTLAAKVSKYEEELAELQRKAPAGAPASGRIATDHDLRRLRGIR